MSAPTVFLDSGVFVEGLTAQWGAAKAFLILGTHKVLRVETSEVVLAEVAAALQRKRIPTDEDSSFARLLRELNIVVHPRPSDEEVRAGIARFLPLLRHRADVPILVTALRAKPDWLVSSNPKHFSADVARGSGLRIVTPPQLMRFLRLEDTPRR